jgi:hypothetical protein
MGDMRGETHPMASLVAIIAKIRKWLGLGTKP